MKTDFELIQPVQSDYVLWDNINEAMRLLRNQYDEQSKTRASISFQQRRANFEWAEQEAKRRLRQREKIS
jgi:hypothetical protein